MTREEAIVILKYNSNVIHKTINGETDPNEVEALDMAIKALKQERTGYWIKYDEGYYVIDRLKPVVHSIRECSECHTKIADFCGELKYCPNCKAKMERTVRG
jgi:hypothetical protein